MVAATTFIKPLRILLVCNATRLRDATLLPIYVYVSAGVMFKDFGSPAGHDDSAVSSAFSLGLPHNYGTSSRCGSNWHLSSVLAAMSTHRYGSLGLCEMYPRCPLTPAQFRALPVQGHGRRAARLMAPAWDSASS